MSFDDAFATHAHELVDWIATYLRDVEQYPVRAQTAPGDIARAVDGPPPEEPEPLDEIVADVRDKLLPGITHWQHPAFLAWFANTATTPGILAEMFAAALNANGMVWASSPAASELEHVTMRWLGELLGLGTGWFGQITDTASTSTLLALAAARESDASLDIRERGLAGRADLPAFRIYTSEFAHTVVDKAAMTLGIGLANIVRVPVDSEYRMRPGELARLIAADRASGCRPMAVVGVSGTTSVASIDPLPAIADICAQEKVWMHVDAAYAGSAAIAPEFRWVLEGAERADSVSVNPHKWLVTPIGCSALWVRDVAALRRAFTVVPEFLKTSARDVTDFHDVGFQLGRPFRALKLWMVLRAYGARGLAQIIRAHCALAQRFAEWVRAEPDWEVAAPVHLSLVCFRYAPAGLAPEQADAANTAILESVNRSGRAFLSHTKLGGRIVLRLAVGNARTEERHVRAAWEALREAAPRKM
ncbi:MAG TPA: pyridoxal-dependent decarboxylase [Gemmatimonadaceae bacterium]|nr:pyridoxal-dependent decarboxylase [Gemmatimonadaceae bacterium]